MVESKTRAFTLIEMLVVIGVIAILAGLILSVLPGAQSKSIRDRVKAEMRSVETALESYKAKHNFYPPDNPKDPSRPPLFYELTGTTYDSSTQEYRSKFAPHDPLLPAAQVQNIFGIGGFLNTAPTEEAADVRSFYPNLLERQARQIPAANPLPAFRVLVAPRQGMDKQPAIWHYNKTNPTNNVGAFDLWAEIELRGEKVVIGNWEK